MLAPRHFTRFKTLASLGAMAALAIATLAQEAAPAPTVPPGPDTVKPKEAPTVKPKPEAAPAPAPTPAPQKPAVIEKTRIAGTKQGDYTGKVVIIPVGEEDLMNPARFEFMSKTMTRATEEGAAAVLFNLDTPGGLAWNTSTMMMQDLKNLGCRSVSYVNPRAMSAGALIAIATEAIYMSPVSSIGAASPINQMDMNMGDTERAKMNSAFMGMARSAAKSNGHNPAVVESMIDKDVGLKIGDVEIIPKGKICTLDQVEATTLHNGQPLLAKGIAKDLQEVLKKEGIKGEVVTAEPKGFELVAIWITQYASILLVIGLVAGYMEMQHPGLGIPGVISAIAFFLFFFGHYTAGSLVGYETVVIFLVGVVLIIVELFVFPGHIVPGLLGLVCLFGALIYTMAGWDFNVPADGAFPVRLDDYAVALRNILIAFVGAMVIIILLMRYFPSSGPFKFLVLDAEVRGEQASIEGEGQRLASSVAVGDPGITRSAMRPYGNVDFGGRQLEAVVEGDYMGPGEKVCVRSITGGKIVVERS